ncbi:MAG TPA: amino acid ABC transporter permease [Deinococcales bacterium]|nr:amino acid ABC transporter permease [Deinococcales bacterium]
MTEEAKSASRSPAAAGGRTTGLLIAGWTLALLAAFFLFFIVLAQVLSLAPEPIGPRAADFAEGARTTLLLTLASGAAGMVLGVLAGLARLSRSPFLRAPAGLYVWVIRGTPLIVQILFVFLALPVIFPILRLSDFQSAVIALAFNVGAYNAEVVRAGVLSVPRGQSEAARSLGLSGFQTMRSIILPQAFRVAVPPLVNNLVALLKDTSLTTVIGLLELTQVAYRLQSETFQPVPVLITSASIYLALTTVMTFFTDALERRMAASGKR